MLMFAGMCSSPSVYGYSQPFRNSLRQHINSGYRDVLGSNRAYWHIKRPQPFHYLQKQSTGVRSMRHWQKTSADNRPFTHGQRAPSQYRPSSYLARTTYRPSGAHHSTARDSGRTTHQSKPSGKRALCDQCKKKL